MRVIFLTTFNITMSKLVENVLSYIESEDIRENAEVKLRFIQYMIGNNIDRIPEDTSLKKRYNILVGELKRNRKPSKTVERDLKIMIFRYKYTGKIVLALAVLLVVSGFLIKRDNIKNGKEKKIRQQGGKKTGNSSSKTSKRNSGR